MRQRGGCANQGVWKAGETARNCLMISFSAHLNYANLAGGGAVLPFTLAKAAAVRVAKQRASLCSRRNRCAPG